MFIPAKVKEVYLAHLLAQLQEHKVGGWEDGRLGGEAHTVHTVWRNVGNGHGRAGGGILAVGKGALVRVRTLGSCSIGSGIHKCRQ